MDAAGPRGSLDWASLPAHVVVLSRYPIVDEKAIQAENIIHGAKGAQSMRAMVVVCGANGNVPLFLKRPLRYSLKKLFD